MLPLSSSATPEIPLVTSVFHPSDFSGAGENAFAHALAIALIRQTAFTILNVGRDGEGDEGWTRFPAVRATLERWSLLEPGSPRSAVFDELNVRVKKVSLSDRDPVAATLDYLDRNPTDLIVLATEGREGIPRWLDRSVAESLARRSETSTLFVPEGAKGFVSMEDGHLSLSRVLLPVDRTPDPRAAIQFATRAARALGNGDVEITALHVGSGGAPAFELPEDPAWHWRVETRTGEVVDEIAAAAADGQADLIIMTTEGHQGVLDALRGSTTERVLRQSPCPLLAVPIVWVDRVTG